MSPLDNNALKICDLHKVYQNGHAALKGISFSIKQGDFFALLGPNGAGKSTTIGIICSLINKTRGKVEIFGYDIDKQFSEAKMHLGVVPQEINLGIFEHCYNVIAKTAGYFGLSKKHAQKRIEFCLKGVGLWDKRKSQVRTLSGGMKRRLMIARALVHEPQLLILDEPTAGVDIESRMAMWDFIKTINNQGTTIILTTHYLEEAERHCRNIAILDHGLIIENTSTRELLQKLSVHTFILDLKEPTSKTPTVSCGTLKKIDNNSIEISIPSQQNFNQIFIELQNQGIEISSLRNKSNRLEELFMRLTTTDQAQNDAE